MTGTNNVYFGWDAATGRLNSQWTTNNTRGTISDLGKTTYTYSAAGKLTARELAFNSRPGVASDYQCYDYDYASRLEAVWTPASKACTTVPTSASTTVAGLGGPAAYAQTYAYTAAGDRSQVKRFDATGALAVTEQYNYAAPGTVGPHQVDSIVSTVNGTPTTRTFTWDAAGRMTGRAGQTLTYAADGFLGTTTGTSTVPANPNPGATNGTPPGPTTGAGSLGTRYYDADGNLVGIVDGSGTTVTLGSVTAHSTPAGVKTATCSYDFAGKTVAQRTAAGGVVKLSLIVGDAVNTAQTITQPTVGAGPLTAVQRYTDPYGLARSANLTGTGNNAYTAAGAGTAGVGSNAANPNGFGAANGFIAGLDDTVSSLTHLGARDMDAVTGAFTTPDPVFHTDKVEGFTPYSYSWGDPINRSDPSGLDWWGDLGKNVGDFWHDYGGRITEAVVTVAVAVVVTAVVATAATACVASVVCAIGVGIAIGATAAAAGYAAGVGMDIATGHEAPTASQFWGGMGQAALIGGATGGLFAGVGAVAGGMLRSTVINSALRTGASAGSTAGASAASSTLARQSFQAAQQETKNLGSQAAARAATSGPAAPKTADFSSTKTAFEHYAKHSLGIVLKSNGRAVPKPSGMGDTPELATFAQYRTAAQDLLGGSKPAGVLEKTRGTDKLRLDPDTGYFGVRTADDVIKTFFRPDGDPMDYYLKQR